ncbi:hypothetical protein EV191_11622 [Tamaricihabitans halophyticus]|uniref:Alkylation response protein AidB-like acyl-CoA dehydrogenase n=1 Tax=Tamaricihabitans halophyticus TaxID=1262583 RepID=A0A4R2Q919_9PSEU|nr:acyl-CoA dehydrogenase family protein [Tamaricihabitans halophyticus]TCP45380.1 hypothetical protein EV191_11622 [Tamaricihabitans halophyticus]
MRLAYSDEHQALRQRLRDYFATLLTPERQAALTTGADYGDGTVYRDIVRQLGKDGWLTLGWPEEYGGSNRPMLEQLIFTDEAAIAGVPVPFLTLNSIGPTIMRFGTPEQRAYYLPRIAAGEIHFAIGYSEPEAGTDLAALRTTATRTESGDEFVVNGQKMWTSLIQYADYVWLACRTNPEAPKHKGLSVLIVPTEAPGFSWTPVHTVSGTTTSATYFEDVRVPATELVGTEDRGWPLITNQLNHERVALTSSAPVLLALRQVRAWAQRTPLADGSRVIDQEWVRTHLARVHAKAEFLKLLNWRVACTAEQAPSPADASANKVFGTEFAIEAYRLLMEVLGQPGYVRAGAPSALLHGRIERMHRSALILTFGGGTNEVQRDIIATTGLGIPATKR